MAGEAREGKSATRPVQLLLPRGTTSTFPRASALEVLEVHSVPYLEVVTTRGFRTRNSYLEVATAVVVAPHSDHHSTALVHHAWGVSLQCHYKLRIGTDLCRY